MNIYLIAWLVCGIIASVLIIKSCYDDGDAITLEHVLFGVLMVLFGCVGLLAYLVENSKNIVLIKGKKK